MQLGIELVKDLIGVIVVVEDKQIIGYQALVWEKIFHDL